MFRWSPSSVTMTSMLLLLMLAGSSVNGEVSVSKNNLKATFFVDKEELVFDNIELGKLKDYPGDGKSIRFGLNIGGCDLSIGASLTNDGILFVVKSLAGGSPAFVFNLTTIDAIEGVNVAFNDSGGRQFNIDNCKAAFTQEEDMYSVEVELSGEVPPGLILTASQAESPTPATTPGKAHEPFDKNYPLILGCVGGGVFLLLILSVIGGIIYWRFHLKQQEREEQEIQNAPMLLLEEGGIAPDTTNKADELQSEVKQTDAVNEKKKSVVEEGKKEDETADKKEANQKSKMKDNEEAKQGDTKKEAPVRNSQEDAHQKT